MRKKINNKVVSIVVALALVCGVVMSAFAANDYVNPTFTDVPKSHWAYTFVEKAVEKGWVSGMGDGTFAPNANVTYSQFCVMLVSAFFPEQLASYTGPSSPWYAPSCAIAAQNDLLLGTRVEQTPTLEGAVSQPMSRYEMALVVSNALYKINAKIPTPQEQADQMDQTPDYWDIPKQYRNAVLLVKATGVLSGVDSAGTFGGSGDLSRAQAAVVLGKLNDLRNTGDGSAVNPNLPEPATPTEITRSPFAFQGSENVQQMMNRLNAEAPKYYEGYLTNGKPITEENIKAMLAEAEKGMPDGTAWTIGETYKYVTPFFGKGWASGCNSFSAGLSDYIFGKNAPVTKHQDFDNIKVGDVIWWKDSSVGWDHVVFVRDVDSTVQGSYVYCNGNLNKKVRWERFDDINNWSATRKAETYVYSRY